MALIVLLAIYGAALWWIWATARRLWKGANSGKWLIGFAVLSLAGAAAGAWCAVRFEYQPKPTMRVAGFPLPGAFFVLEDGHWTDFVPPPPMQIAAIVGNVLIGVAVFVMPIRIVYRFYRRAVITSGNGQ